MLIFLLVNATTRAPINHQAAAKQQQNLSLKEVSRDWAGFVALDEIKPIRDIEKQFGTQRRHLEISSPIHRFYEHQQQKAATPLANSSHAVAKARRAARRIQSAGYQNGPMGEDAN